MTKQLYLSTELPLDAQLRENWGWENSNQLLELDTKFQDMDYFYEMDTEHFFHLIRKMDNFLRERGLSEYFISNYGKANVAFHYIDEKTKLSLNTQCSENRSFENDYLLFETDIEFKSMGYFDNMDPNDLFHLIRKMDNFLRERGLSEYFISNYGKANIAFHFIEKKLNEEQL